MYNLPMRTREIFSQLNFVCLLCANKRNKTTRKRLKIDTSRCVKNVNQYSTLLWILCLDLDLHLLLLTYTAKRTELYCTVLAFLWFKYMYITTQLNYITPLMLPSLTLLLLFFLLFSSWMQPKFQTLCDHFIDSVSVLSFLPSSSLFSFSLSWGGRINLF